MKFKKGDYIRYVGHPEWDSRIGATQDTLIFLKDKMKDIKYIKIIDVGSASCITEFYFKNKTKQYYSEYSKKLHVIAETNTSFTFGFNPDFINDTFILDKQRFNKLNRILK